MKTQLRAEGRGPTKYVEGQKFVDGCVEHFKSLRAKHGPGVDIGVEFHGAVQPPTALSLWMAELARRTHISVATGEWIFTKWGFKEILEKRAAATRPPPRLLMR